MNYFSDATTSSGLPALPTGTAIKIQVKYLDHLFRIYIKAMGKETLSRVEESINPNKPALETINNIFNPMEKIERQMAEFRDEMNTKISAIFDLVSKRD